jgi:hypothetical protein
MPLHLPFCRIWVDYVQLFSHLGPLLCLFLCHRFITYIDVVGRVCTFLSGKAWLWSITVSFFLFLHAIINMLFAPITLILLSTLALVRAGVTDVFFNQDQRNAK